MATAYERIVSQIQVIFIKDAEGRLRVGHLVAKALEAGGNLSRLADDVGVSRTTLQGYMYVAEFWGSDRMAAGADGRPATWGNYMTVEHCANQMDEDDGQELKRRMVKGGRDAYDAWWRQKMLDRVVRSGAYQNVDPHQPLFDALRQARYTLNHSDDIELPPLTEMDKRKVRDLLRDIIAEASLMGITVAATPSRRRAA